MRKVTDKPQEIVNFKKIQQEIFSKLDVLRYLYAPYTQLSSLSEKEKILFIVIFRLFFEHIENKPRIETEEEKNLLFQQFLQNNNKVSQIICLKISSLETSEGLELLTKIETMISQLIQYGQNKADRFTWNGIIIDSYTSNEIKKIIFEGRKSHYKRMI